MSGAGGDKKRGPVIVIAAGGTGGHIFPAIATGREIERLRPDATVIYACGERPLELELYRTNGIEPVIFPARQIRPGLAGKVGGVVAAAGNVWRARQWVKSVGADLAVGFGGYVAGPTVLGAKFAGCRTAIHEANSIPGRTNRILGRMMDLTAAHFESTLGFLGGKKKLALGMPLRRLARKGDKAAARRALGLDPEKFTLLIMGGSQGARYLYEQIAARLEELDGDVPVPVQVLWSTGQGNFEEVQKAVGALELKRMEVRLVPFISDMESALEAADMAVARAGASALAELTAFRVYTVYVPFPGAIYDHQTLNAREAERFGLGAVLPEREVRANLVAAVLAGIEKVSGGYVAEPPQNLDSTDAAERLAGELLALL